MQGFIVYVFPLHYTHTQKGVKLISIFLFFLSPPFLILPNLILSYLFDLNQPIYSFDYREKWPVAIAEMAKWIEEGKLKRRFTVVDGLDKAYDALNMLFSGGNTGKT